MFNRDSVRYGSEAVQYFSALSSPPPRAWKKTISEFIYNLQVSGIWAQLDIAYFHAALEDQAGKLNIKTPGKFTCSGSPTFTANKGHTGDGAASRLSTTWDASANGVNYTQNSAGFGLYCITNSAANAFDIGRNAATGDILLCCRTAGGGASYSINDDTATAPVVGTSNGFYHAQRRSSTDKRLFKDGSSVSAVSVTSTGVGASATWVCGANSTDFSARQIAFSWFGGPLIGQEAQFNTYIVQALQGVGAI